MISAIAVPCSTMTTRFPLQYGSLQGSKMANGVMAEFKEGTRKSFLSASCAFAIATVLFSLDVNALSVLVIFCCCC